MTDVAVLRYEQDGDHFLCCCSTQGHDRTYTFKRVAMDERAELFQCVDCLRAVSHFNEDPAAIGTVRMEEGSDQLATSPDEPQGLPHLCRRQTSRQATKKELGAKSSADASPEVSGGPTPSSSSGHASTSNTPTNKKNLQRRKPSFPKAKRSSGQKPAKEEASVASTAEAPGGSDPPADSSMKPTESTVPAPTQPSPRTPKKKKSPLLSLIVLDDSPEPPSGSTENPIFLDDFPPPVVQTFGVPTFKDKEKRVLVYESRRYKGRTFEFHHFKTDHTKSKSLYRCLACKAIAEKLPNQKMLGVLVKQGVIYHYDPDYLFGDDGHLCMTYDANGARIPIPEGSGQNRAEKSHESTTERLSDDATESFGRAEFDEVEQIIKFRSRLHEGHVFEFEHCNTKNGRRFYVCRGCRAENGRKMITAHNGTLVDQDPDRGHRCVSTSTSATEPPKRATPKRAAAAAALRTLEASESDDDGVVDESDLPEDSIWRLDDSPVKSRASSSSSSWRSTPQSQKQQASAAPHVHQQTPAAQQAPANPVHPTIRMVWAPPQKVFGRANFKDPANTVLVYESRRWPGEILIFCREGPNMSGRQRFKCRRCTSFPEGKQRGHPPVIVQDGEIINQDPDELYNPEGHICMQDNASEGTPASGSKPIPTQSARTPQPQGVRSETPAVVVNPCPRPGRPASSVMSRQPPKVVAPAKFEDASEELLLYESRRFPGTVFRFCKKSGGATGKRFYTCVDCDPLSVTKRKPVRVASVLDGNIVGNDPDSLYDEVGHLCQADASRPYLTPAPPRASSGTPIASSPASDASATPKRSVASETKKPKKAHACSESPRAPTRTSEPARKQAVRSDGPARRTRASAAMEAESTPVSVPTSEGARNQASRASSCSVSSVSSGNGNASTPLPVEPEPADEAMHSPDDYVPAPSPGPSPSTPVSARSPSEQPPLGTEGIGVDAGAVAVKQELIEQETENVPPPPTPGTADASRKRPAETPATQTAVKQEPTDSVEGEVPAKRSRQAESTPRPGETGQEAEQQEPEDFGEAVFADESQRVLLYESRRHPGATLKFLRASSSDGASYYVCTKCAIICKQRKLKMGRLVVQDGRLMTDPEIINGEGHGHYCLEELAEHPPRQTVACEPSQTEATGEQHQVEQPAIEARAEQANPSVQSTDPVASDALAAEAPPLRAPKREPLEDPDVELLDGPRVPEVPVKKRRSSCTSSSTNTPSLPPLTAASSFSKPSIAYFGDAVYDRPDDPSSFTYESDLYGSFKFVLLDEVEKEDCGQLYIMRLYRCEACFTLSQTHTYKDEVVHTIMTSGQRIVKYDPDTPRGIPHLCVRHRRSIVKKPVA